MWRQLRLDCDLLVNCTGLDGARDIFGDDSVYPIRGQVRAGALVRAEMQLLLLDGCRAM